MTKKKQLTEQEIFCGMPYLQQYFQNQAYQIKKLEKEEKDKQSLQKKKERRARLLKTAKGLCVHDLEIVYYINNIANLAPYRILCKLRQLNAKVEEWDKLLKGEEVEK